MGTLRSADGCHSVPGSVRPPSDPVTDPASDPPPDGPGQHHHRRGERRTAVTNSLATGVPSLRSGLPPPRLTQPGHPGVRYASVGTA